MTLFEAVIVYVLLILVLSTLKDLYPLILFGFMVSFIALSLVSIFDSAGTFTTTTFSGTVTQKTWLELLYGSLTLVSFYKAYWIAWRGKQKHISEGE